MSNVSAILDPHLRLYSEAAEELGFTVNVVHPKRLIEYSSDGMKWKIFMASTPLNDGAATSLSQSKSTTNLVLKLAGIPVPKQFSFFKFEEAFEFFKNYKYPIVVKPDKGVAGRGVTIKPDLNTFESAFKQAKEICKLVILEDFIPGVNYRLLVLDNKVIAAAERLPAFVVGDGQSTVQSLINLENSKRSINNNFSKIEINRIVLDVLNEQNLNLESVVEKDTQVLLRHNSNLSTGGVTINCSKDVHPDNAQLAVDACRAIGLGLGGVDLIIPDIRKSWKDTNCGINEINHNPGLRIHYYPYLGEPVKVAVPIQQSIKAKITKLIL